MIYWSGTTYAPNTSYAWVFSFGNGRQLNLNKSVNFYAWAVSPGDVGAAVPVPGAVWLFGSALAVMGALRRRILNRTAA